MRVVIAVQAKASSSRGLVHYIAHSKIDESREAAGREIFNSYADSVSVEKANDFLKSGASVKRPANNELHHLVISLKPEDYERLGADERERKDALKKITRAAMKELETAVGADRLNWAAGVHRNTDNPHVHIAIQKEFFDKNFERKSLGKIPLDCLPHYERQSDVKTLAPGRVIEAATAKLDEIIAEKAKQQSKQNPHKQTQKTRVAEKQKDSIVNAPDKTVSSANPNSENERTREILARAILAKFYLDKTRENLESLETNGHLRRFKITDAVTGQKRQMSLFDLERRAEKEAMRQIKKLNVTDAAKKGQLKQKTVAAEIEKNAEGVKRIRAILHNLIVKENRNLETRESDYKKIKPVAEQIRKAFARENKKLPAPLLSKAEVEMLQAASVEKRDVRAANYFERVRQELARERNQPARADEEIQRLKALQIVSELKVQAQEKQLKDLHERKRFATVEINGEKWSLNRADALIEKSLAGERKITARIGKAFRKIASVEREDETAKFEEIKSAVAAKLSGKTEQIETDLRREKSVSKMLGEFYPMEEHAAKEILPPKFTTNELAEVESLAFELKNADRYRENWEAQKQFIKGGDNATQNGKEINESKEKTIAGRAVAREIMCETETARAKEELTVFKKNKIFQKFEVADTKTGETRFVSLKEVEFNQRGSILDQTLEYFTENREKRRTRRELEKTVKAKESELKENLKSSRELLKAAAGETADYKQKSFFGAVSYTVAPVFTPKELVALEIRIKQTENKSEAKNLQKIFDSADFSAAKNLSAILASVARENDAAQSAQTQPVNERTETQSAVKSQVEKQMNRNDERENKIRSENAVARDKAAENHHEPSR